MVLKNTTQAATDLVQCTVYRPSGEKLSVETQHMYVSVWKTAVSSKTVSFTNPQPSIVSLYSILWRKSNATPD